MKQPIYLVVGTPGSGKTWVCKQLGDKYDHLAHDDYSDSKRYVKDAMHNVDYNAINSIHKPTLIETPFSVSQVMEPIEAKGYTVIPVFIIESPDTTAKRYEEREYKPIPQGHLTRIETYRQRAKELKAFSGTSEQVLAYLKGKV